MHTIVYKISHQDPLCNTRKHTEHSVITYMEKEPPKKTCIRVCGNEPVAVFEKEKKKRLEFTYRLQFKWKEKNRKKEKQKNADSIASGHSDLGWGHIPGARVVCIPRLECPRADGAGSRGQVECLHKEPGLPVASCSAPNLETQVGEIKSLELMYTGDQSTYLITQRCL